MHLRLKDRPRIVDSDDLEIRAQPVLYIISKNRVREIRGFIEYFATI